MDINFENQQFPRKVVIVNEPTQPIKAEIENWPLSGDGTSIRVQPNSSYLFGFTATTNTSYIVSFDNILILNSDGGFASLPMNTSLYNVTQAQLDTALANIKSAYSSLVANSAAATLHYCRFNASKILESFSYNLKE